MQYTVNNTGNRLTPIKLGRQAHRSRVQVVRHNIARSALLLPSIFRRHSASEVTRGDVSDAS
jgi:hypothetical protein